MNVASGQESERSVVRVKVPVPASNRSGGHRILAAVANALAAHGAKVTMLVPDYASQVVFPTGESIEVAVVSTGSSRRLRKPLYILGLIRHACRACDYCLVTTYWLTYVCLAAKLIHRRTARVVFLVQGNEAVLLRKAPWGRIRKSVAAAAAWLSYKLPLQQIVVSAWLKRTVGNKSAVHIPNGVASVFFHSRHPSRERPERFVVGTIGHDAEYKGYDLVCQAVERLGDSEGNPPELIVASVRDVSLPSSVDAELRVCTDDESMAAFYSDCDVFVFASEDEGFGLPPLEAMAGGVPVVTTDCGGNADYLNGENAAVVARDVVAIGEALTDLRTSPEERQRLSAEGRKTANDFREALMVDAYVEFFFSDHARQTPSSGSEPFA